LNAADDVRKAVDYAFERYGELADLVRPVEEYGADWAGEIALRQAAGVYNASLERIADRAREEIKDDYGERYGD
jgi:hypothetical protein